MKRTTKWGTALAACLAATVALAANGTDLLNSHKAKVQQMDELTAKYTVTEIGGTSAEYEVTLKRPNMARIESPTQTMVFDGENVTKYDKKDNTFYVVEQDEDALKSALKDPALAIWSAFYDEKAFEKWSASDEGTRTRNGLDLRILELTEPKEDGMSVTLFLESNDLLPRQATLDFTENRETVSKVVNAEMVVASVANQDLFAFVAPEGAEEIDPNAVPNEWILDDLDEPLRLAKASGKPIILNFHATWCGPCKAMKAAVFDNDDFAEESGNFVLARVDIDIRDDIAGKYNIRSIPTTVFLDSNGNEMFRVTGSRPLGEFLNLMNRALDEA